MTRYGQKAEACVLTALCQVLFSASE